MATPAKQVATTLPQNNMESQKGPWTTAVLLKRCSMGFHLSLNENRARLPCYLDIPTLTCVMWFQLGQKRGRGNIDMSRLTLKGVLLRFCDLV